MIKRIDNKDYIELKKKITKLIKKYENDLEVGNYGIVDGSGELETAIKDLKEITNI